MKKEKEKDKFEEYTLTSSYGMITIENLETFKGKSLILGSLGVQISKDGRLWICIDGVAFLRFKPIS